jgi:peptidylprolyl isomerase
MIGNYVAYDWSGKTSKLLGSSYTQGAPSIFVGSLLPGLETALVGQKLGSRVLAVIPPKDAFGTSGNSSEGIGANDTLVFVIDIGSTFATGSVPGTQASNGGGALPTVTAPAAGSTAGPTIKIPAKTTAPKTLQVKTLIKGKGAKVAKGQDIAVQYTGVIWRTGKVFDSSWSRNTPLTTVIGEGQVIPGWDTGLVGQTVGSRVMLVIPPADGYGSAGASQAGINGTDTLVFVVDILAASYLASVPRSPGSPGERVWATGREATRRERRRRPPPGSTRGPRPGSGPWSTGRPGSRGAPPPGRQPEP